MNLQKNFADNLLKTAGRLGMLSLWLSCCTRQAATSLRSALPFGSLGSTAAAFKRSCV